MVIVEDHNIYFQKKLEHLEETIKNLTKENKQKDSEFISKIRETKDLKDENKRLKERINNLDEPKIENENENEKLYHTCEKKIHN